MLTPLASRPAAVEEDFVEAGVALGGAEVDRTSYQVPSQSGARKRTPVPIADAPGPEASSPLKSQRLSAEGGAAFAVALELHDQVVGAGVPQTI